MAGSGAEPTGSLDQALAHASALLAAHPEAAVAQARAILEAVPGHPKALVVMGAGLRSLGQFRQSRDILAALAATQPGAPSVHFELGLTLGAAGEGAAAIAALSRAVQLNPQLVQAWRELGDHLTLAGDSDGADQAYARHIRASARNPALIEAASALCENRIAVAERLLRSYLKDQPTDVAALRMLAETGSRLGRYDDAEKLLVRALELSPSFSAARHNLATILYRQSKAPEALAQIERLTGEDARNPAYRALQAAILGQIGDYAAAIAIYETLLASHPQQPKAWMSYGHALKAVGRQGDGVAAYRRTIALMPSLGEAYWSLANLKTFRFSDDEVGAMQAQLARPDLADDDRYHLHFALGKALEDRDSHDDAFSQYASGNALRRAGIDYDPDEISDHVTRSKRVFTPGFLSARTGMGNPAPDPIFIIGLPRSGSTLVEQILSSHSAIEGTMELPNIIGLAKRLSGKRSRTEASAYPECLANLDAADLHALGQEFLDGTRIHRKLGRAFYIDKMPNNFAHAGLIHLILPNARIIDARRHPLGCCFSGFKQHFARGQNFTYDLTEIGRYYVDYVRLMAHFDAVLPGRIHRVIYEDMIANPEREVRSLLDYCGLDFEDACLRFYENDRPVRTASSEQVRRPINTDGLDQWKRFETHLAPLKASLGEVLDAYPAVPDFSS